MESFQDGGQQNIKSEHNEYPPPMEGSHMNAEMNNFSQTSGEGSMGPESFSKMPDGMHPNQMQNYPGYNRGNYGMGDQHGGMMAGSVDYNNQNSQFSGQFSQTPVRPSYPGMPKPGMSPVRPGMMPPGMGMMPGSYSSSQRMMSSQGMSQSGPTPTLNQLLQTPNSGQRFPANYGDFSGGQGKGGEMSGGSSYAMPQQGWNGNPRSMGSYPQGSMPGTAYRSQGSSMSENRRPSGMSPGPGPGYPHQGQYMSPAMAVNAQRYMMGQVRPGQMSPMSSHGYNQQMPPHSQMNYSPSMPNQTSQPPNQQQQQQHQQMYHGQQQQPQPPGQPPPQPSPTPSQQQQSSSSSLSSHRPPSSQGTSPKQASPAPPGMADQNSNHSTSSKKSEENAESNKENSHGDEANGENETCTPGGGSQSHLAVAPIRPVPSPAGSTGSRSDTPASNSGTQVGSPMPPRPPSSQLEGQGHSSHSPMATQAGFNQQMMPPPMSGQMGYPAGAGGKMGGPAGMASGQMPPHFSQYNSQYPQGGNFSRQQGMGGMQGGAGPGAMPGGNYPQAMYNGPGTQMPPGTPNMYNMMNRGMQSYNTPYGPGTGMPMNSQYGSFNSHMGPGQGPGPGPGPGSGPGPGQSSSGSMPMPGAMMGAQGGMTAMGQQSMAMQQGGSMMPGSKGAQAAAQAALMAAANSAGARMPGRAMAGSPRMMGPQGSGASSPGMMNHVVGNLGNPSLNSMSNQIQQITSNSVTVPSKPSSPAGSTSHAPSSAAGTPTPADSAPSNSNGVSHSGNNHSGGDTANLMSPLSGSDTQESSRPSSTATPGQTADTANSASDTAGSDGSGSMPSSDSTSVDSGFHSAADHSEKPPSESTPTHSSSPSNSNPPPSTNGPCEDRASQDAESRSRRSRMDSSTSSISTSVQTSSTTTAVTSALPVTAVTQSISTPVSSETESSGSQTTSSMAMMSSVNSSNTSPAPTCNSTPNGPHYPHSHHGMGYPMGSQGPGPGPMGNSHVMPSPGMHHPSMHNSMPPYNMPPGSMASNMPPGSMASSMLPGGMPGNMPPGGMPGNMPPGGMPGSMQPGGMSTNMPPGGMSSNMPPGGILPGNMAPAGMMNSMSSTPHGAVPNNMPAGSMPNNMPSGGMPNHMPPGSMPSSMPPRSSIGNSVNSNSMGPMNMPPQSNCAPPMPSTPDEPPEKKKKDEGVMVGAGPSFCEDFENPSSPGWPGMPKSTDLTKLYDMGNEMDRRPFLDKLLTFLEEKGTPVTAMPSISKQPLDLYRLYHCVGEKGGMVEVNRGKKWKEICTVVNIGSSASAAFTLKKNYIRYLFAFECKFERGGLDPAPILAEMEAQLEKKREQKKRVPSPGSQSSQDAFQQPPTPNSQMMDGFPSGPGMPPPYMQGPDGPMVPGPMGAHGPGMMMPNSMMGHPNMLGGQAGMPPHPGPMGSGGGMMGHGPSSMMMPGAGPVASQNMMGGGSMPQQGGMMGPGGGMMGPGIHMGPNSYSAGPPTSMISQGPSSNSSSMGPSPGPPMMAGSVASTASSSASNSSAVGCSSVSSMAPPTSSSIPLPPSSTPNSRPPTADSVSVQDPFADEPSKASSPATFAQRPGPSGPSPSPVGFPSPGPPTTSSAPGFGSRPSSASNPSAPPFPNGPGNEQGPNAFRRLPEGFQPSSSGSFPGRSENAQFPFGHESSSHPAQPFRPSSGSSDPAYAARFPGQQPPFRPPGPGEPFSSTQPFPTHGPVFGPRMPGQEGFSSYPSPQHPGVRPPMSREGSYSGPAGGSVSQYSDWNGGGGMGHSTYSSHLDSHCDFNMSGREGGPWSPMHAQRSYMPPNAPGTPPMGPYARPPQRASPQARDKLMASKLQSKSGSMVPNTPFPPKKEIVFPPDSVEAVQPTLTKRRRLTHKDLGPVEAWRLMMALKSGLLAESTWAIDTLNILLFDDSTVAYFNLTHLPGLLEVLTEHFRAALIHIFHILRDRELRGKAVTCPHKVKDCTVKWEEEESGDEVLATLVRAPCEVGLDKTVYTGDYTMVSRQGKAVKLEEDSEDRAVLDTKQWDHFCLFGGGARHWQKGGGDITQHVVPCLESSRTHKLLTDLFFCQRTCSKETGREGGVKRKAASGEEKGVHNGHSGGDACLLCPHARCSKQCKQQDAEVDRDQAAAEEQISLNGGSGKENHSRAGSQEVHRNNFMKRVEIQQEPQDSELHRCESDDSLPPPVLPAAAQDGKASNEESVKAENGPDSLGDETEDKPAPPHLTREEGDGEESTEESEAGRARPARTDFEMPEKMDTGSSPEGAAADDDAMTAEIVAMMVKEHDGEMEEEAYHHDDPPLTTIQSDQEEIARRCVAISNIFRSLSCIPGNEALLSGHHGIMLLLGRLLMLHHRHPPRSRAKPAPPLPKEEGEDQAEEVKAEPAEAGVAEGEKDYATSPEWWWETLEALRENTLVVLANICSHMRMSDMDSEVCLPILDGLLHWMICPSSSACDPLPSAASTSQLSPQRLVLEALCKLCIHDDNVDLLLATPPFSRILILMGRLMRLLSERSQPVPREFSIVLLSRLVQGDPVAARAIALQHPSISLLIEFLESAEQSAMAVASQQGYSVLQSNPEVMGTSLDMLRRAASTLLHMARVPENRKLFLHHQSRLLTLVMSQILDTSITQIISDILFECSQVAPPQT